MNLVCLPRRVTGGGWYVLYRTVVDADYPHNMEFIMANTLALNGASNDANTTNNLINTLLTVGNIVNNTNRTLIQELYGDRIVSKHPSTDVVLPNGYALPDWSLSLRNLVPKYQDLVGLDKAIQISLAILKSFMPYAPYVQGIKGANGKLCNIILTFKSTAEMNRILLAESLEGTDVSDLVEALDLSNEKYFSFSQRAYLMTDGTKVSE